MDFTSILGLSSAQEDEHVALEAVLEKLHIQYNAEHTLLDKINMVCRACVFSTKRCEEYRRRTSSLIVLNESLRESNKLAKVQLDQQKLLQLSEGTLEETEPSRKRSVFEVIQEWQRQHESKFESQAELVSLQKTNEDLLFENQSLKQKLVSMNEDLQRLKDKLSNQIVDPQTCNVPILNDDLKRKFLASFNVDAAESGEDILAFLENSLVTLIHDLQSDFQRSLVLEKVQSDKYKSLCTHNQLRQEDYF